MRELIPGTLLLVLSACGGPSLGEPTAPTSSQQQANGQVNNSAGQLAEIGAKPENAFGLYGSISALGPSAAGPGSRGQALYTAGLSPEDLSPAGCASGAAATGWTYNNCQSGGTTINGSVKISGTRVDLDLQIGASAQGANVKLTLVGSVNNDGSRMTGDLTHELKLDLGGFPGVPGGAGNQKTTVKYDMSYTKAPACVTGGTVLVTYETSGVSGAAQFEYSGCNQFKVRNSK